MPDRPPISLLSLFAAFLHVSCLSFGGGLVWARRVVVQQRRWTTEDSSPTSSPCAVPSRPQRHRHRRLRGSETKRPGRSHRRRRRLHRHPLHDRFRTRIVVSPVLHLAVFRDILHGVSAVAAGLLIATGIQLLLPHRRRPRAWLIAALAFAGMAFTRLPLLAVLLGGTLLSLGVRQIQSAGTR